MANLTRCPEYNADLDGGPIPENVRQYYSPPYRWSRAISIYDQDADQHDRWMCPDCKHEWRS